MIVARPLVVPASIILMALPWLSLALCWYYPERFSLDISNDDEMEQPGRTPLMLGVMLGGMMLCMYLYTRVNFLGFAGAHIIALLLAGLLIWVARLVDRRSPWVRQPGAVGLYFVLCCVPYGYGAGLFANLLLDDRPAAIEPAEVTNRHYFRGKDAHAEFTLGAFKLADGTEYPAGLKARVDWRLYRDTATGERVCLALYDGALGVSWYRVRACMDGTGQAG